MVQPIRTLLLSCLSRVRCLGAGTSSENKRLVAEGEEECIHWCSSFARLAHSAGLTRIRGMTHLRRTAPFSPIHQTVNINEHTWQHDIRDTNHYMYSPVSASSSNWSTPISPWVSQRRAISSEVCVIRGFGIMDIGAGSRGIDASSASRSVDTTAWWNSNKSSPGNYKKCLLKSNNSHFHKAFK